MFDHVVFGVSDYAKSKAFFLEALEPLGVAVVSEGPPRRGALPSPTTIHHSASVKLRKRQRIFTWRSLPKIVSKFWISIVLHFGQELKTMVSPVFGRSTTRTTMQLSSLAPDGHNIEVVCHEPEA